MANNYQSLALTATTLMLAFATAFAQPTLQWASNFAGPIANDAGKLIALCPDGNPVVAGISDSTNTGTDIIIVKYKADGGILWTHRFNGTGNGDDAPYALRVDAAGNIYVVGTTWIGGVAYNDMVTIKISPAGVRQWFATFNLADGWEDVAVDLAIDAFQNVYVVGSSGIYYGQVIKYDHSTGAEIWSRSIDYFNDENGGQILINSLGNVVVSVFTSTNGYWARYSIYELNPSNGQPINKYNQVSVIESSGIPNSMHSDGAGNIYIINTGVQGGDSDPHEVSVTKFTHGNNKLAWVSSEYTNYPKKNVAVSSKMDADLNIYVLSDLYDGQSHRFHLKKYNSSGVAQWSKNYDITPNFDDIPVSLALDKLTNPNLYVAGYNSKGDITLAAFDNGGNQLWNPVTYDCGILGLDNASAMVLGNCGDIYLTGSSNCNSTYQDVRTLKYSSLTASISTSGSSTICQGEKRNLIASNGTTYLWNTGATTQNIEVMPQATTSYTVTVYSGASCSAVSQPFPVTVNPTVPVNVTIAGSTAICSGDNATFTATPSTGVTAPVYQWFVNTQYVGSGATYSTATLSNGATVYCTMTSSTTCPSTTTATSNTVSVIVNPKPQVTIAVDQPTICAGDPATLTASGSGAATFQWTGGPMLSAYTIHPTSTTTYTVTGKSAEGCTATASAQVKVNPILPPSVSINDPGGICAGQSVTFTPTPTNGGAPTYKWFVQTIGQVGTGPTYTTNSLKNGDKVYCVMHSSETCARPDTAISPTKTITVLALPNVQIAANDSTTFCAGIGNSVTLTASPNGSAYLWSPGGATGKSITISAAGTYTYTVNVKAFNGCSATSAPTTVTVNTPPPTPPMFPPGPVNLCLGDSVELTTLSFNSYLWSTGATGQSITVKSPGNYAVTVKDANGCTATPNPVFVMVMTAHPNITLSVICSGNDATVTATPTDGGANPIYQWSVNGGTPNIQTDPAFQVMNGQPTWVVKCQMTSNADCATPTTSPEKSILLDCTVGTVAAALPEGFNIFPNPSTGAFAVEFFLPEPKTAELRVLNALGQVVWSDVATQQSGNFRREIALGSAIAPSIYWLETRLDGAGFSRKIVMQ